MDKKIGFILLFLLGGCLSNSMVFDMSCNLGENDCKQLSQVMKVMEGSLKLPYGKLENKIGQLDKLCDANNHYACRAVSSYYIDNYNYIKAAQYLEKICNMNKVELIDSCDEASYIYKQNLNDNKKYIQLQQKILYLKNQKVIK